MKQSDFVFLKYRYHKRRKNRKADTDEKNTKKTKTDRCSV